MKKYVLLGAALISLAAAVPARAATVMDFAFGPTGGTISYTGATLSTSTSLNLGGGPYVVNLVSATDTTGALAGITTLALAPTTLNYVIGSTEAIAGNFTKTFTTVLGTFTETMTSISAVSSSLFPNIVGLVLTGTISGPGFAPGTAATMILNANQAGGPGQQVNWSATELSNAPLPGALPLFAGGLGLVGWLAAGRRRKSHSVSILGA